MATLSAYLFAFPENDIACASRQPIIFTSLSLIGTLLSTRAWRIGSILAPAADFASSAGGGEISYRGNNNSSRSKLTIERAHTVAMNILTRLCTLSIACGKSRRITLGGGGKGIRRQIDTTQLLFVTVILMMPQLTLQILNVVIPIMRATSTNRPIVPFVIGLVLTALPFFLALLLNTSEGSSWQIFQEYEMIKSSVLIALTVLVITIPSMLMVPAEVEVPNLTAFLQTASLLGLALPLFYQIAFVKFISIRTKSFDNSKDVLSRKKSSDSASSQMNDDAVKISAAEEAMTMAKMLGHMGSLDASVDAFHKTLSFFKLQGKYSIQDGFTRKEIQSFSAKSLEVVVTALVTMAKTIDTHSPRELCTKPVLDALSIYDSAPGRRHLKDRSFVFPVLSYICVGVQGGKILEFPEGQDQADYLLDVANTFVSETEYQCFHHCRALALKAASLAQQLKFDKAVEVINGMNRIYDPVKHSRIIAEEYGSDHCCNAMALSALWLKHLGREQEAIIMCDDVIERCLPEIDERNMLGRILLLIPSIAVLLAYGQLERTVELFTQFVMEPVKRFGQNWSSPAKPVIRPMSLLLKICSQSEVLITELDDDIEWLLNDQEKMPDLVDTIYTSKAQWSPYDLYSEICLRIAKKLEKDDPRRALLMTEGLRLSHLADSKLKNESGDVVHPIAFSIHNAVMSELEELV